MREKKYESILDSLPIAYAMQRIILDDMGIPIDYEYIEVNTEFERYTKRNRSDIVGKKVTEIYPRICEDKFDWVAYYGNIALNCLESEFKEYSESTQRWYKVKVVSREKGYFTTYFIDISKEVKEWNLYKNVLSSMDEGVIALDVDGNITMINRFAKQMLGCMNMNMKDMNLDTKQIFNHCANFDFNSIDNLIKTVLRTKTAIRNQTIEMKNAERNLTISFNIFPIQNPNTEIEDVVIRFTDITDRIEKQTQIDYITYHDNLTDTYNRNYYVNQIHMFDVEENLPISVIMADVNGLKLTNDAFGHHFGDQLLKTASDVMKKACRKCDKIIRWGGDEFIILLPNTSEAQVREISERIKQNCENEKIASINLSISLGYATKETMEQELAQTISISEELMYRVKMLESRSQKSKTLQVITMTLQEKNKQDAEHSKNVSRMCKRLGRALGYSHKEITELGILGDIHDIGRVVISEEVLNKRDMLSKEDWEMIQKHPEVGYHIVLSSPELSFLADSVLSHHERYDGTGYPKGLKGSQIPINARILTIADAFDSMVNQRSFKKALSEEEALAELIRCKGTQFDPNIVDVFVKMCREEGF